MTDVVNALLLFDASSEPIIMVAVEPPQQVISYHFEPDDLTQAFSVAAIFLVGEADLTYGAAFTVCECLQCPSEGEGEGEGSSLTVILEPAETTEAGALWQLDGGEWLSSGATIQELTAGTYTVTFGVAEGWVVPEPQEIHIEAGQSVTLIGLYSMTLKMAFENFTDAGVPAADAADDLFDAFSQAIKENGYDTAAESLDRLVEEYVAEDGNYLDLCTRSAEIPPTLYADEEVLERRISGARGFLREEKVGPKYGIALPEYVGHAAAEKASSCTNWAIFVNGINTTFTDFLKGEEALAQALQPFAAVIGLGCSGIYNNTGGFLSDLLAECTIQKLLEIVEVWTNVSIENPTTSQVRSIIEDYVDAGKNVIVVPHSQGNFHVREAVDKISMLRRASISVLQTASPASYMPDGLRNVSRVDIDGDLVAGLSGMADDPFPYEGVWGWGTWLAYLVNLGSLGIINIDVIDLLNRHSFDGAYLQGQAKAVIQQRIRWYCGYVPIATETILLPGDVSLTMVWIPAGSYMMGAYPDELYSSSDEDPQHQVSMPGFWMGKYELTKAQWTAVMGTTPWSGHSSVLYDPDSPAVYVSWNYAQSFISALNTYTGMTFRLPSEAEWEYACRAGRTTRFYWGDDPSGTLIGDYAWYERNALNADEMYAHVVGLKLPNAFGLHDMSGNVREWCQDWYHDSYTGAPADGSPWESPVDLRRIVRGGNWVDTDPSCRSADRHSIYPSNSGFSFGFRLAR